MSRIDCPHCGSKHRLDELTSPAQEDARCPETGFFIPPRYLDDHERISPLRLMTIGWPEVGKTTYLTVLVLALQRLTDLFDGAWFRTLGTATSRRISAMREQIESSRRAPSATVSGEPIAPLLLQVVGFPGCEQRCLVLHDAPGEDFKEVESARKLHALHKVRTAWFLVSVPDLDRLSTHGRLSDLFNIYLDVLERQRVDPSEAKLIVVYTKADSTDLPTEIKSYLDDDPLGGVFQKIAPERIEEARVQLTTGRYFSRLQQVSDLLEEFTRDRVVGGAGFVSLVKATGMKMVFCLTSALGAGTQDDRRLDTDVLPHRILDPLLWAFALDEPKALLDIGLVLDPRLGGDIITGVSAPLWESLSEIAEVTPYSLGRCQPFAGHAELLPDRRPKGRRPPALLGPVVERMPRSRIVVLLASEPPIDIESLDDERWRHRLCALWTDGGYRRGLDHELIHLADSDRSAVLAKVRSLAG